MIKALLVRDSDLGIKSSVEEIVASDLPQDGELLVKVHHSSINYKDALAITNNGKIIRGPLPFVPGIDLVGTVVQSTDDRFPVGIKVIGTGGGLGETTWGGLSTLQRVPSKWFVRLPPELSPHDSMVIGTAGVTAMLSVMALERAGVRPDAGDILVTGATGGVGSFAVKLLSIAGYNAIACTGKKDAAPYLSSLGATRIVDRHQFNSGPQRPLDKATWAGAIDTLGTSTLARIISQTARHGAIAVCGMAEGSDLSTTVFPFILRGVSLLGIDSNTCPVSVREAVWSRLAESLSTEFLRSISTEIDLSQAVSIADELIKGKVTGRFVVTMPV